MSTNSPFVAERQRILTALAKNPHLLCLSLSETNDISKIFRKDWGIRHFDSSEKALDALYDEVPTSIVDRYFDIYEKREPFANRKDAPANIDRAFYSTISSEPLAGIIHSLRRSVIIDMTTVVISLARKTGIVGPILDLGCHTGAMTVVIADHLGIKAIGIDIAEKAIETAKRHVSDDTRVSFYSADFRKKLPIDGIELVYCVDSLPNKRTEMKQVLSNVNDAMIDGGLLVIAGNSRPDNLNAIFSEAAKIGFTCYFVLPVGGFMPAEGNVQLETAFIFLKDGGSHSVIDCPVQDGSWEEFIEYIQYRSTKRYERTIGYFRSKTSGLK